MDWLRLPGPPACVPLRWPKHLARHPGARRSRLGPWSSRLWWPGRRPA